MMKTYKLIAIAFIFALFASSCYHEDLIIPSEAGEFGHFEFPQGDAPHDMKLKAIYDQFGIKVIYKNFRNEHFNLSWTNLATGKLGYDIPEDQQAEAANFMADQFFAHLKPEFTKRILPPYFYIADSIYAITANTPALSVTTAYPYTYDGLDFWLFAWNGFQGVMVVNGNEMLNGTRVPRPRTPFEYFYRSRVMLKEVYKSAVEKEYIAVPDGFNAGFDFTTAVQTAASQKANPNYYIRRGFPGQFNNKTNFNAAVLANITRTNPRQNFIDYLHLCMRYQPDSIQIVYPQEEYPIIHEKYPIIINYMKEKYGIDLNAIASKPEL